MKNFKFKWLLLSVILSLASINTMWAASSVTGGYIYFDPSTSGWGAVSSVEYVISHDSYSCWYAMSNVANTKLYYISSNSWNDAKYIAFTGNYGWTSCEGNSYDSRKGYGPSGNKHTAKSTYGVNSGSVYLFYTSSSSNDASITTSSPAGYKSGGVTDLNSTQTVKFSVSNNGATPAELSSGTTPAQIRMRSYKFTSGTNGSVSAESPSDWSAGSSTYNKTFTAARTATTTLTVSNVVDGYTFLGWYSAANGGTELSTNLAYTYYPTAATTVYARFSHETTHSVDITYVCASPSATVSTATSQAIGQVTASSITAPTVTGYTFSNWTLGTGISNQSANTSANPISVKTLSSGNYTMQANYTEDLSSPYIVTGGNKIVTTGTAWRTTADANNKMLKKTGHSTESVAYFTVSVDATNTGASNGNYQFKLYNTSTSAYWGLTGSGQYYLMRGESGTAKTASSPGINIELRADMTGDYEIKVDYSTPASPTVTVTFPEEETHTVTVTRNIDDDDIGTINVTSVEAPITTASSTITATLVNTGAYYFAGWTIPDGVTLASGTATSTSITINATEDDKTITANFVELDKVYFRNENATTGSVLWSDVYVYFNTSYQDGCAKSSATASHIVHMTRLTGTNIWWAYVPRDVTAAAYANIAFSDYNFGTNYKFFGHNAADRGDYNRILNMFVPNHTKKETKNSTDYYSNGYWMKYNTEERVGAGYYLKRRTGNNSYSQLGEFVASATGGTTIQYTVRIDNLSQDKYLITSAGGINYKAASTITSSAYSNVSVNEDNGSDAYFTLTPVSEGDYTIILAQDSDVMMMFVNYPVSAGDYRLKHTYSGGTKTSYSDIIKAGEASSTNTESMFLSKDGSPTLVLQKCTGITDGEPEWTSGDGDNLSDVLSAVSSGGNGVYQFDVTINTSTHKVSAVANIDEYKGNFYIKTDCAPGGWPNYKRNAMSENTINFDPEKTNTFDYYFCRWISNTTTNVKCVIANDYNNAISDTLKSDAILTRNEIAYQTLPKEANVRFSYNSATNELKRTYLLGSSGASSFLYIVSNFDNFVYNGLTDLYDVDEDNAARKFTDLGNWTYQMNLQAYTTAQAGVKTKYPDTGTIHEQTLVPVNNVLIGGDDKSASTYDITVVYDFKTDYLMSAWTPSPDIADNLKDVDVLLMREAQNPGTAITFNGGSLVAKKMIGAIKIDYDDMVGKVSAWNSTTRPLLKYFISFPFDVNVNDVFGLNSAYGDAYVIQKYNGAKRAEKGFFKGDGTTTFWEDLTLDSVMHANEGYCVILDNDYFNSNTYHLWDNKSEGSSIYLYFPSAGTVNTISSTSKTITVPAHECKIDRTYTSGSGRTLNHKNTDSHWNMMGVPIFDNHTGNATSGTPGAIFVTEGDTAKDCHYFYAWSSADNLFRITAATGYTFKAMHSYFVQYTGNVTFTGSAPASVVARRASEPESQKLELQVLNGENDILNRAYIELRENACDTFALNEDVYMSSNNAAANIYTFAGDYDVAANVLSIGNHTIPVGLEVRTAGTYAISMPSSFSGTATLIDTETGERTNLAISDYEATLPKGVVDDRFLLEISDISNVITDIEYTTGEGSLKDGKPHKFVQNGLLYIVRDGVIYDAQGSRIK